MPFPLHPVPLLRYPSSWVHVASNCSMSPFRRSICNQTRICVSHASLLANGIARNLHAVTSTRADNFYSTCTLHLSLLLLQATHCRTMVPCQDTPSIKHTYYAQVTRTPATTRLFWVKPVLAGYENARSLLTSSGLTSHLNICSRSDVNLKACVRCLFPKSW